MATRPGIRSEPASTLMEREEAMGVLAHVLDETVAGAGRLVLLGGEAGVGKTALAQHFCARRTSGFRVLRGSCDALFTPRPLGPLLDVAAATGGELEALVTREARPHEVTSELLAVLHAQPTILVLEDAHWADEATLDVIRLLARRIEQASALVLVTYRDDELDRQHPLRIVLGELASSGAQIVRLRLEPLSPTAVRALARPYHIDADDLYGKTAGNPFFVTEVLAGGANEIPTTVRDAVLARAARLSASAMRLLEAVAVVPPQAELWLLEGLAGDDVERMDDCLASGMLLPTQGGVAYRHELARIAVEQGLAPTRRLELNRSALGTLAAARDGAHDLTRLAHHAEAAGDAEAVLRYAPAAAAQAAALGAHREAAAQYARALRMVSDLTPADTQADLLEGYAYECYVTGEVDEAITAQKRALERRRALGDRLREGDSLRSLSRLLRYVGSADEAMQTGREAVAVLEQLPPSRELGMAYCNLSHLHMHLEDVTETVHWGRQALDLAERLGDPEISVYALTNIGNVEQFAGENSDKLERSLRLAQAEGLEEHAGRAFVALTWWTSRGRHYAAAEPYLEAGLEYCTQRGLELWRNFLLAQQARAHLDRGRWDSAVDAAALVLANPRTSAVPRVVALSMLGLVRARRGDPETWPALDEAQALAEGTGELQRMEPASLARAEAHWLQGRHDEVARVTQRTFDLAHERRAWWIVGELASWRRRAGTHEEVPVEVAEPWAAQLAGDWKQAADVWRNLDSPYEEALALCEASDEAALRRSLELALELGARPLAAIVSRRLRKLGVSDVPRGPRPSTQANPAQLTAREVEVLELVAEGLRNSDIAERLVLSRRTVDHHVSAILRKLDASTRGEAAAAGTRLGLLEDR